MAKAKSTPAKPAEPAREYTVVARRYRPKQFAELIGQEHVSQALINALQTGRVAHAYLFTGARGTGKTSAARILAKALNCVEGPTATPCDKCESCLAIAEGQDVDVQEIDGASNNKVDEARDLRQNVGFRPTRSRYKIYIIDEVHMLSTGAFNALLKTLEEPPSHVKFILATTEIQKIPITILSRCQRFDFSHVGPAKIYDQLKSIVEREGHEADEAALRIIARRANGSMRDSQSLLDQLLAACPGKLTSEHVQSVLGAAGDERVAEIAAAILNRDATKALNLLGEAVERGLQLGELTDQLVEYWRSLMLVACGGPGVEDLPVTPTQKERILEQAKGTSLDTILSGLDVLTTMKSRMRGSSHLAVLLEMAIIRLARLEDMLSVGQLLKAAAGQGPMPVVAASPPRSSPAGLSPLPPGDVKKNGSLTPSEPQSTVESQPISAVEISPQTLPELWDRLIRQFEEQAPVLASYLRLANLPAIFGPNALAIRYLGEYSHAYDFCATDRNAAKIQETFRKLTGQPVVLKFERTTTGSPPPNPAASAKPAPAKPYGTKNGLMALPLFRRAAEVLGAQLTRADEAFDPTAAVPAPQAEDKSPTADTEEV